MAEVGSLDWYGFFVVKFYLVKLNSSENRFCSVYCPKSSRILLYASFVRLNSFLGLLVSWFNFCFL